MLQCNYFSQPSHYLHKLVLLCPWRCTPSNSVHRSRVPLKPARPKRTTNSHRHRSMLIMQLLLFCLPANRPNFQPASASQSYHYLIPNHRALITHILRGKLAHVGISCQLQKAVCLSTVRVCAAKLAFGNILFIFTHSKWAGKTASSVCDHHVLSCSLSYKACQWALIAAFSLGSEEAKKG